MSFKDNVVLVTGGARGIGKKICERFLDEGCKVCILDVQEELGKETVSAFNKDLGKVMAFFYKCDITDIEQTKEIVKEIIQEHKEVNILVNNAGITRDNLMMRMDIDDWEKVINVNLTGAFICSKAVIRYMLKARRGKIINISSIVGVHGNAGQCNYSASKAGLIGLTKSLAKEVANRGINVNAVAPGYIETDMTEKLDEKVKERLLEAIPSKRLGSVDDVAETVVFLASERSDYITGTVIGIDGGMGI